MIGQVKEQPRVVLEVQDLTVDYRSRQRNRAVRVVHGVSFRLRAGQTLGLVGESGSGKSTTALAVLGLIPSSGGSIRILDDELTGMRGRARRRMRKHIQLVMQNPYSSLNPRMSVGALLAEPLAIFGVPGGRTKQDRIAELLEMVGLPAAFAERYPHQLSGGQRQRVSIARALAVDPEILVCDEALSALDVSIQAQILALIADLQARLNLAVLFISHDLSVVRSLCDEVAVMKSGEIVESAQSDELFANPTHDYTRTLLSAAPHADPTRARASRWSDPAARAESFPSPHFALAER